MSLTRSQVGSEGPAAACCPAVKPVSQSIKTLSQRPFAKSWLSCRLQEANELPRAVQVTTEGGFDAAMEAPYIYAAIDALALRAGKWAERRQRLILEGVSADAAVVTPEAASAAAIAAVKEVCLLSPSQEHQDLQDQSGPASEPNHHPTSCALALLLEWKLLSRPGQPHAPSRQGAPV